jgi:hypothetical protein
VKFTLRCGQSDPGKRTYHDTNSSGSLGDGTGLRGDTQSVPANACQLALPRPKGRASPCRGGLPAISMLRASSSLLAVVVNGRRRAAGRRRTKMRRCAGQQFNPYRVFYGIYIPEALLQYPHLSAGAKLCYGALCRFAGEKGLCWPSQAQLAATVGGISVRNTRRHLKELESRGFIRVVQMGLHRSNRYAFLWHEIFDGSERTDLSGQDRTELSHPDRTRSSAPSGRKSSSAEESAAAAAAVPTPALFAVERQAKKSLRRIHADDAKHIKERLREAEGRGQEIR